MRWLHNNYPNNLGLGLKKVIKPEVGTHYFFRSPLPLVHNLEKIVFALCASPQLSKIGSPLALVRYSATAIFYIVRCH
jgi:hypothetical protein